MSHPPPDILANLTPPRLDAIHRALLSGLLSNVGSKTDSNEYSGARGTKFHLFPGSGLFKKSPRWVMAAELVETTRLYARTNAKVQVEWIERLAAHVLTRTYSNPRWDTERAEAVTDEKVSLWGMVLVPARAVSLAPVDPRAARQLFIQHALVEGDYYTHAPFWKHNDKLLADVRALEAKSRRRDVLVEDQVRFAFYDARLPLDVWSGITFEKWRRHAERLDPRLLQMTRRDLMRHAAHDVTADLFPDFITVNGQALTLSYDLDPGGPMDGITVAVPLAVLNQLPAERFEWLVPGVVREKVDDLIRSLPKAVRVNFIPVADTAEAAVAVLQPEDTLSLYDALAIYLGRRAGVSVSRADFDPATLPPHLFMNFKVIDAKGKTIATGRDLNAIRRQLGVQAKETFAALPKTGIERDGLVRWDFGDLPERVEVKRGGLTLYGYPTLVDKGATAALEVRDSADAARQSMRAGVRRLFMLQVADDLRYLERNISGAEAMSLNYATLGSYKELKADLLAAAADRAFFDDQPIDVRTQAAFVARAQEGWRRLVPVFRELAAAVGEALGEYQELEKKLSVPFAPMLHPSVADMKQQLAHLVYRGFVVHTPWPALRGLRRYLKAMQVRLAKLLNAGLARDQQHLNAIAPLWRQYLERLAKHRKDGIVDPELTAYRWMIEELRVSLFAQELRAAVPVSVQRVERQWEKVR